MTRDATSHPPTPEAPWRRAFGLLLAVEIGGIIWLVLNPSSATPSGAVYRISALVLEVGAPPWAASITGWEYLLNVLLFLPLGFLSTLIWPRIPLEVLVIVGCAVSSGLELAQLAALDQRSSSLTDISANTIGMFAGAVLGGLVLALLERDGAGATRRTPRLR